MPGDQSPKKYELKELKDCIQVLDYALKAENTVNEKKESLVEK